AAAELLSVRVANEVVLDARAEVIRVLHAGQDPPEEDVVDVVGGVEPERRYRAVAEAWLEAVRAGSEALDVRVAAGPAVAELDAQLVLDRPELCLGREPPHPELDGVVDPGARRRALDGAPDGGELGLDAELVEQ